jgi:hypothetical protein
MTLPDERFQAVANVREFIYDLLDPKKTPRVPKAVRVRARGLLKHYPYESDMERVAERAPDIFALRNKR